MLSLLLFLACGDKEPGPDSEADTDTDTDSDTDTDTDSDSDSDSDTDAAFHATGTYDGDSFEVDCNFDETDPEYTGGLQCQEGIQLWAWCRPDPEDPKVAGLDVFQVWFAIYSSEGSPGTYDVVGANNISVGDGMGAPLSSSTENVLDAEIVVDSVTLWESASGSFSGSWDGTDTWAGTHTAEISGTFDIVCP